MEKHPLKVLVLCTGNSCRSIMAEALINHFGQGCYQAWSAGTMPARYVHPKSIETLQRHGISPGNPSSKSVDEVAWQAYDLIITVCDQAAGETCPIFPGQPKKLHWSTPDPAKASDSESDAAFDTAFLMLKKNVVELTDGRLLLTPTPVVS
ncbi:MAG: arsenate reductase ArsC [Nitrospira sp.]